MQDINWDLVQFKYEFLGFSLDDLAREHSISKAVLDYNSKDWKAVSLEQDLSFDMSEIKTIEDILTKLNNQVINQTQAFLILKQKFLSPKFIELETTILHKAISIINLLDEKDSRSAKTLKELTEVLVGLLNQNPMLKSGGMPEGEGDKIWEVRVVEAETKPTTASEKE